LIKEEEEAALRDRVSLSIDLKIESMWNLYSITVGVVTPSSAPGTSSARFRFEGLDWLPVALSPENILVVQSLHCVHSSTLEVYNRHHKAFTNEVCYHKLQCFTLEVFVFTLEATYFSQEATNTVALIN